MNNVFSRQDAKTLRAFKPSVFFASLRLCVSIRLLTYVLCLLSSAAHAQLRSPTDAAVATAAGLRNGLLAYWAFDEGTGATIADVTGHGYTATTTNSPSWITGKLGGGMNFTGTNTRAGLAAATTNVFNCETSRVFTVTAWVKWDECGVAERWGVLAGSALASTEKGWNVMVDNRVSLGITNALRGYGVRGQNGNFAWFLQANNAVTSAGWTHVAMVMGATNRFFVNGSPVQTYAINTNGLLSTGGSTRTLNLGRSNHSADLANEITLDEVAIHNRALSDADVHRLCAYGRGTRWPFLVSPPANP